MRLTHLKIGARLALAFGVVLLLLSLLSVISLARMNGMRQQMDGVTRGTHVESSLAQEMRLSATQQSVRVRNILMLSEPDEIAKEADVLKADVKRYEAAKARLAAAEAEARLAALEAERAKRLFNTGAAPREDVLTGAWRLSPIEKVA